MSAPTVFIVDDDPGLRASLAILLQTALMKTECYSSAEDFLGACGPHPEGCVLLDVRMPGMSGPEVHREMARRKLGLPVIFLTGYAELQTGVEAIKQGAVDFLTKPVNGALLIERVQAALALDRRQREAQAARRALERRVLKLSARERKVLLLALSGRSSKEISLDLKISQRTVEGHRARIYLKTGVSSLLELAQQAAAAGIALDAVLTTAAGGAAAA